MTAPVQDVPAEWRGILRKNERILWQGRPKEAFYWRTQYNSGIAGGAAALIVLFLLTDTHTGVIYAIWALAIGSALGWPLWDAIKRHYSFFTLTDRRAFIGTDMPVLGRQLASYPIDRTSELRLEPGALSAVYFAHEMRPNKYGEYRVDIGFENITEGQKVYDMMRQIKETAT